MKKTVFWLAAFAILTSGLLFTSCGGKEKGEVGASVAESVKTPVATSSKSAQQDYLQPYLTDEKMAKFIASMKEERNPFELIFKQGGQMQSLSDIKDRLEEYNAFAKNYGFENYEDYISVWGRITVAEMLIWSDSMKESTLKMFESTIKNAEENLKKPGLDPEMKKMYEEQITDSQKSLADMQKKDDDTLNAADLELVKKYKAQIDEAAEKFKKKTT